MTVKKYVMWFLGITVIIGILLGMRFFSEESQNKFKRFMDAGVGFKHGRADILSASGKPAITWLAVEKITSGDGTRAYRYGYGYSDLNLNGVVDLNEKKLGKRYFDTNNFTDLIFRDMGFTNYESKKVLK